MKIVSEDARINGFDKVDKIEVIVGDLSNVLSDVLECLHEFEPDYRIALCAKCGIPNCLLVSGETFKVDSYEGSVEHEN